MSLANCLGSFCNGIAHCCAYISYNQLDCALLSFLCVDHSITFFSHKREKYSRGKSTDSMCSSLPNGRGTFLYIMSMCDENIMNLSTSNYSDPGGTLEKIKQPKPLFSGNEEHCNSKEVKGNALPCEQSLFRSS